MINRVVLVGRMVADPELRYTPSGVAVTNFRIAVDRRMPNAQGEREADFIDIVAWRQSAEFVSKYLTKGQQVAVDGRLQARQWTTPDGQKRKTVEVVADSVQGLARPRGQGEAGVEAPPPAEAEPTTEEGFAGGTDPWATE